jgi:hypothetical protein
MQRIGVSAFSEEGFGPFGVVGLKFADLAEPMAFVS